MMFTGGGGADADGPAPPKGPSIHPKVVKRKVFESVTRHSALVSCAEQRRERGASWKIESRAGTSRTSGTFRKIETLPEQNFSNFSNLLNISNTMEGRVVIGGRAS